MKYSIISALIFSSVLMAGVALSIPGVPGVQGAYAQGAKNDAGAQPADPTRVNITDEGFTLNVCDGPTLPPNVKKPFENYRPCNFNALMMLAQKFINLMIVLGVLAAIIGFLFAGYLYMTGAPANINRAIKIFKTVGIGFVIMLSAWFIVYQILDWLSVEAEYKALLNIK